MEPYDSLIRILEAFIEGFGGRIRVRGIKTALLIQQSSMDGSGISISELARQSNAPLESVRRHMAQHVEQGSIRYIADPDDERVTRIVVTEQGDLASQIATVIHQLGEKKPDAPVTINPSVYDLLVNVLDSFLDNYPGQLRVRSLKTALLIQRATLQGSGITVSEIARQTSTPLENVRRHIGNYQKQGIVYFADDPADERVNRVLFTDPGNESRRVSSIVGRLQQLNRMGQNVSLMPG